MKGNARAIRALYGHQDVEANCKLSGHKMLSLIRIKSIGSY
jgi:hypothetical protein